jgi:hypothetical protein
MNLRKSKPVRARRVRAICLPPFANCAKDGAAPTEVKRGFPLIMLGDPGWMKEERMPTSVWRYFDPLSIVIIVLTLVLFLIALFVNGFTHDLLQECGVFLVSVKLIVMSHKNGVSARHAEEQLASIQNLLEARREQSA